MKKQMTPWEKIDAYMLQHPVVDSTITFIDSTVLRPIPIAWATAVTVLGYGFMQFTAREVGFALSGSEIWLLFVSGWLLGYTSELVVALLRKR